jgi:hypothetical protein
MAALAADAVWIQDAWRLRRVSLRPSTRIQARRDGREVLFTAGPDPPGERLTLIFQSAETGRRWLAELEALRPLVPDGPEADPPAPEGVALVRRAPDVPHVVVGRLEYTDRNGPAADRGLQLRAGMRGADAVIQVKRERCPDLGWGARRVSGLAVRVEDSAARQRLRVR